jgi:superfamily II DNA/RNA helicase
VSCISPQTWPRASRTGLSARNKKAFYLNSFDGFGLNDLIARAIAEENYTTPTPIQVQTIPIVMSRRDVIGIAQTGTGKTAAFALPILHVLAANPRDPTRKGCRVLVLSPTRELSSQILDSFRAYSRHLPIQTALAIGGVPMGGQVGALAGGVDVLVATPGRLLDLLKSNALRLGDVEFLVLDEADRMLHGNKSQGQRERVLAAFRRGDVKTLVATDIAARGIDIDGISHVVNFDLPHVAETYVHRIGRTARAGADGVAISLCGPDEVPLLRAIEKLIGKSVPASVAQARKRRNAAPNPRPRAGQQANHSRRDQRWRHDNSAVTVRTSQEPIVGSRDGIAGVAFLRRDPRSWRKVASAAR